MRPVTALFLVFCSSLVAADPALIQDLSAVGRCPDALVRFAVLNPGGTVIDIPVRLSDGTVERTVVASAVLPGEARLLFLPGPSPRGAL